MNTQQATPQFSRGDLVSYAGEEWYVDDVYPGSTYYAPYLTLGQSTGGHGWARGTVVEVHPEKVTMISRLVERSMCGGFVCWHCGDTMRMAADFTSTCPTCGNTV